MTKVEELKGKAKYTTVINDNDGKDTHTGYHFETPEELESFEQAVREEERERTIKLIIKELPDSCFMPNTNHDESTMYNYLKGVLTQPTKEK